jgi:hypothetical protein
MDSGGGMNNGGMNSTGSGMKSNRSSGENKGLPGGHSGDDLNKPGNGDHGNNGGNGGRSGSCRCTLGHSIKSASGL